MTWAAAVASPEAPRVRLTRFIALFERQGARWTLGACILLALLMRAPYVSVPLGRDEAGLALVARHWGGASLYGDYWVDRPPLLLVLFKIGVLGGDVGLRVLGALAAVVLVVLIAMLARAIAGPRAGMIAGLLAALLTGSQAMGAVYTPGELLAAVPSTLSVLCLVRAHGSRDHRDLIAAGALAVSAVLVKQSFLDAGFAGAVFVLASAISDRKVRVRWPIAYAAGAVLPLLVVLAWLAAAQLSLDYFIYTLFRFRLDLVHTLADSSIPLHVRFKQLKEPAWDSGLVLAMGGAVLGLFPLRHDRVLLVTFAAWMAAAVVGVLGGGSYFAHYLIELIPVSCVAASAALARVPMPIGVAALAAVAYLALGSAKEGSDYVDRHVPHRRELAVGNYIKDHARAGDTQYVMYARPNVVYYAGLPQPYPYLWSLMVRVRPRARPQLERLLGSSRRPTWLVMWHLPSRWGLDPDGTFERTVASRYRLSAVICGYPVFVRDDRPARPITFTSCS